MKIPSHPMPARSEQLLYLMRVALTRAAQWESTSGNRADAWGSLAGAALESAIDVDAGAA